MSSEAPDVRDVRLAKNQALFREVNERFERASEAIGADGQLGFVCECSDTECATQVMLAHDEYEHVRSVPTWFLVMPGHLVADMESTVTVTERYSIVEKRETAAAVALATDPRRGL